MLRSPLVWSWLILALFPARMWLRGAVGTAAVTTPAWCCGLAALALAWRRDRFASVAWLPAWWGAWPAAGVLLVGLQLQVSIPSPVPFGLVYCCVCLLACVWGFSSTRERFFRRLNALSATALALPLGLFLVAALDRLVVSPFVPPPAFRALYPPHYRAHYKTIELDFTIATNSRGLRDPERDYRSRPPVRILCIGDSYTVGWGVNAPDTWIAILQRELGDDVQLVNAGKGGIGPPEYADIAEELAPELRPDVILVGVLQGDDLMQSVPRPAAGPRSQEPLPRGLGQALCPNLFALRDRAAGETVEIRSTWKEEAAEVHRRLRPRLDPEAAKLWLAGDVNAGLITLALTQPNWLAVTMDLHDPVAKRHLGEMANHFRRIKAVADRIEARLVICSVPLGAYTTREDWESRRRVNFQVEERFLTSSAPDEATRLACEAAEVDFVSVTSLFRQEATRSKTPLFYYWDGHFTAQGNRAFAKLIEPQIRSLLHARSLSSGIVNPAER